MKIAIAAATGNIGSRTARQISAAGTNTILLGRDVGKLDALEINGATGIETDLSDADFVIKATARTYDVVTPTTFKKFVENKLLPNLN